MKKSFKTSIEKFIRNNKGFGIKEIAAALGFIVIVGLVISAIRGSLLTNWLSDIWGWITSFINNNVK